MHNGVENSMYEHTRENIIREIRQFVKGDIAGDHFVFTSQLLAVRFHTSLSLPRRGSFHRSQIGLALNRAERTKACLRSPFHRANHIDIKYLAAKWSAGHRKYVGMHVSTMMLRFVLSSSHFTPSNKQDFTRLVKGLYSQTSLNAKTNAPQQNTFPTFRDIFDQRSINETSPGLRLSPQPSTSFQI